jgi:catechol 2,3-dioxygenase-like lactoylglutathione lyase family enzyme
VKRIINLGRVTPVVPSRDVGRSLEFYRDMLGFRELFHVGDPPTYAGVERDKAEVHFVKCDSPMAFEWSAYRVKVTGIDQFYAICRSHGIVHPNGDLTEKLWGTREFANLDGDGVAVVFWQAR